MPWTKASSSPSRSSPWPTCSPPWAPGSALYVAHADDPEAARREVAECNERFLSGLGVHPVDVHG